MNKQRKTSNILNVFQYDEVTGAVTLPSTLVLTAPDGSDNSTKVPTTAWTRSYVSGLSYLTGNQSITVSGDATGSGTTSINLTLANTAVTPGTYGSTTLVPVVTVDSKGRITSVTTAAISGSLSFTGDVTGTGTTGTSTGLTLANSGVTAGTYTKVTVDSKGRVTVGASATTTDIAEGTRLYYTDARVLAYLGANNYATQSYVSTQINNLVSGAPGLLDTLDELAASLGDDPNFATTVSTALGNRLRIDTAAQGLSGTQQSNGRTNLGLGTAATSAIGDFATAAQGTKADTAHGWGNHASAGYLTSATAATTYLTQSTASSTYLTSTNAASTYLSQTSASNTYLTLTNAASTYLSQTSASNTYLTLTNAASTYLSQTSASSNYLTITNASSTYLTQTSASSNYVSLSGSYANPSWITSLAYSKITGVPAFLTSYTETDPFRVTTVAVTGTSTKTITLTRADNSTVTTTWTDIDTDTNTFASSLGFSGGTLTLTNNNSSTVTVSLDGRYYLASNPNSYITSSSNISGSSASAPILTASGSLTTQYGNGTIGYSYALTNPQTGLFSAVDNSNAIITINRHPDNYYSQLGFSSNGNLYYRSFSAAAINTSQGWQTIWTSNSLTNLNQLTNGPGYITGESDTLATVTSRGNTTTGSINVNGNILMTGTATTTNQARTIDFTGFDKEGVTDFSDRAYIQHTTNTGGHTGSVLVIASENDAEDGIAFLTNASSKLKHNSNNIATESFVTSQGYITSSPLSSYLPLTGGSISGTLTTNAQLAVNDNIVIYGNNKQIQWNAAASADLFISAIPGTRTIEIRNGNAASPNYAACGLITGYATFTSNVTIQGNITVSSSNTTGGGIILADDGDIVDLNDAYCSMRFSYGVRIYSANRGGSPVITLANTGVVTATTFSGALSGNATTASSISGFNNPTTAATANTIVYRDGSGDVAAREFVLTASTIHVDTPSSMLGIYPTTNQVVKFGSPAARNFLNVPTRTGGDASGTWGISISGNAATASYSSLDFRHSDRDFPAGTLVQTNINYAVSSGDAFVLEIRGNSYFNTIPFDVQIQGYIYGDTIISTGGYSNGKYIDGIRAINFNGNLCFWWPSGGYWEGFNVKVYAAFASFPSNRVTSITNSTQPTTAKQVNFSPVQSLHSGNFNSYAPSLTGGNASGTWGINITGNAGSVNSRTVGNGKGNIGYFDANGNLYISNPESYSGEVRLGAAWNRGGIYTSSTLSLSTGSGTIDMVYSDTTRFRYYYDSNGTRFMVNTTSTPYTLIDGEARPVMYVRGRYPVLTLDHTVTSNTLHGPTIQFVFDGLSSRQWVIGTAGNGSQMDFGMSNAALSNTNYNPHNGIGGYQGKTLMRMTETGVLIGDCGTYPTNNTPSYALQVNGAISCNDIVRTSNFRLAGTLVLSGSGAEIGNSTGTRMTESYGVVWNCGNGATWHHQVINGSSLCGFNAGGGNFGSGNYYGTGDVTAYYSDERLKTKINTITDAIEKIKSLEGFVYVENELARSLGYTNEKEQAGVSAQQIQAVLPQAVSLAPFDMQGVAETGEVISKTGENYLTVKYDRIVPLLIEGIKEQQKQIEELQKKLDSLIQN